MIRSLRNLATVGLLLAACSPGEDRPPDPGSSGADGTESPTRMPARSAEELRDWIASYAGRPVLVNFWATWCGPCVEEMPDFLATAAEFESEGLVALTVAMDPMVYGYPVDRMTTRVPDFLDERGWALPCALFDGEAKPGRLAELLGFQGQLPTTVIVSRSGERIDVHRGRASKAEFVAFARRAIAAE